MNERPRQLRSGAASSLGVEAEIERALRQSGRLAEDRMRSAARVGAGVVHAILDLSARHQRVLAFAETDPAAFASRFIRFLAADFAQSRERGGQVPSMPEARTSTRGQGAPRRFGDFSTLLIEDWAGPVAGSTQIEETLRIPRSTLHRWQKRNEVVALRTGGRKHVFPLAQFLDGRPAPGIRDVIAVFGHARPAWAWLTIPLPALDGRSPLDLLKADDVGRVLDAARSCVAVAMAGDPEPADRDHG